ncbi:MAG: anaerobic ribonucleoside-triphosphate reductase activating protein [Bacillota bacterium]|nr:anaerobic ribonucleoside-triphosphate reductase activating protein [Bacillota bacterium]
MSKLRLAGVIRNSIVDGPGIRMVVFTQGCFHNCEGCHNPESHDPNCGYESDTENIIKEMKKDPLLSGITLSGGEPFLQPQPLYELAKAAHEIGLNVVTYTGYTYEQLLDGFNDNPYWKELLEETDFLIDGPFILSERSLLLHFRGSKNQRLIDVKKTMQTNEIVLWE